MPEDVQTNSLPKVWSMRDPDCPKDAVWVGRGHDPRDNGHRSRWGNPYDLPHDLEAEADRETVNALFRTYAERRLAEKPNWLDYLRGKDLVFNYADKRSSAHVLLEMANPDVCFQEVAGGT